MGVVSGRRTAILAAGRYPIRPNRGGALMVPGEGAPWTCDWQASEIKIVSQPWICSCHFESKIRMKGGHDRLRISAAAQS